MTNDAYYKMSKLQIQQKRSKDLASEVLEAGGLNAGQHGGPTVETAQNLTIGTFDTDNLGFIQTHFHANKTWILNLFILLIPLYELFDSTD